MLLAASCAASDDSVKTVTTNITNAATVRETTPKADVKFTTAASEKVSVSTTTTESLPLLEDLVLAEERFIKNENANNHNDEDDDDSESEKNTAKRTISSKFTGPIVVDDDVNLFTPADEYSKKQINVQIIEPEGHNNGQFLKETLFVKQENSTVVTSKTTTTSTTELPYRRKIAGVTQKSISSKFLAPIQAGLRLSNEDDDCDDKTEKANVVVERGRKIQNIDIQQNTKIQKVSYQDEPQQNLAFGTRFSSTTRTPCDQSLPCSTPKYVQPAPTPPQARAFTPTPYLPPRKLVTTPVVTTPVPRITTYAPIHVAKTTVVPKPIYIHTQTQVPVERIVDRPVAIPVDRIVKEYVNVPVEKVVPVEVEKLVVKEVKVPVTQVVEKHIQHAPNFLERIVPYPVQTIVDRPVEVEKVITKEIPIAVDRIVEKIIDRPVEVERIVEKEVPVPVNHVVEKIVDRPVEVEKIVEKQVPLLVEKFIDRPIPIEVAYPVHIPYLLQVEVPVHAPYPVHIPYHVVKPPPPPPKHFIIKTTKYGKGHGLFDWKHGLHHKHVKHVFFKKPNIISDDIIATPTIDTIGLVPPPRFLIYFALVFTACTVFAIDFILLFAGFNHSSATISAQKRQHQSIMYKQCCRIRTEVTVNTSLAHHHFTMASAVTTTN